MDRSGTAPQPSHRSTAQLLWEVAVAIGRLLRGQVVQRVGGPARARVIVAFGAVLALSGADTATVGAVAPQLERGLHINNAELGLLSSASLLAVLLVVRPVGCAEERLPGVAVRGLTPALSGMASIDMAG